VCPTMRFVKQVQFVNIDNTSDNMLIINVKHYHYKTKSVYYMHIVLSY